MAGDLPIPPGLANAAATEKEPTSESEVPLKESTETSGSAPSGDDPVSDRGKEGRRSDDPRPGLQRQEEERPLDQQAARARDLARDARERGDEVVVNIGGAGASHEPSHGINVNNQAVARRDIPYHVEADGSEIGKLFDPATVDRVEGHNMPPGVVDWARAAPGAYRILRPGGRFEYYWRGANPDAQLCARALRASGFRDVEVISDVLVKATKPR
jgi:hypothetical protein